VYKRKNSQKRRIHAKFPIDYLG